MLRTRPRTTPTCCRRGPFQLAWLMATLVLIFAAPGWIGDAAWAQTAAESQTSTLLVKLVSGLSAEQQAAVIARNGGTIKSVVAPLHLYIVDVAAGDLAQVLANYQGDSQVASVEQDKVRQSGAFVSDLLFPDQWALPKIGWDTVFGTVIPSGIAKVAILDTGVDAQHPDIAGKVFSGTSILDGTNGMTDPSGHGTWVAGIVAANTNNAVGVAGVAYQGVEIVPVTVLDPTGAGKDSDVVQGVVWAADNGANVILMAFSAEGFSSALQDAIDYAWSKGAVLVAAVGNDASSTPTFPAGHRGVMGVAATDQNDAPAPWSNAGQSVFLAAPGVSIETTTIGDPPYVVTSGTSASAAMVAGVAGFMKAVDPSLSNGVIVGRIARTADPAGTQAQTGNGRINMARALEDTSTEPIQPAGADPVGAGGPFVGPYRAAGNVSSLSGKVTTDGTTGLAGATVTCTTTSGCNANITVTTDANGNYTFSGQNKLSFSANNQVTLTLTASKTGYVSSSQDVTVNPPDTISNVNFTLAAACTPPSITTQPTGATKTVGESVTFSVTAGGTAPLSYQWRKNGSPISGATGSSYTISSVLTSDAGSYDVVVSNSCGSATSSAATLTVNKATPTVSTWPTASGITYGQALSASILSGGTASVPGSFAFTTPATTPNAGTYSAPVTFTPTDTNNYNTVSGTVSVEVAKASQTITFAPLADKTYGDPAFTVSATGGASGNPVTFTATGNCTAGGTNGSLITITGAGSCTVTAHQAGNANYNAAPDVPRTFQIAKANATISVTPYNVTYDGAAHTATGTATGVGGADLSAQLNLSGTTHTSAGDYPSDAWTFSGGTNYNDASGTVHDRISYSWSGVLQPINSDNTSIFKLGSTVPVKFQLTGAGSSVTNLLAKLYLQKVSGDTIGTEWADAISTSAADSGNTFRYDSTANQYIFNLATKPLSQGTWALRIDLGDGILHTVLISLKK